MNCTLRILAAIQTIMETVILENEDLLLYTHRQGGDTPIAATGHLTLYTKEGVESLHILP